MHQVYVLYLTEAHKNGNRRGAVSYLWQKYWRQDGADGSNRSGTFPELLLAVRAHLDNKTGYIHCKSNIRGKYQEVGLRVRLLAYRGVA